ncbi:lamin tail domain-containing protein [Stigmatella erecta]|uniref:SMI1 / KNR4 family (SUKH-1) n=1 Tax=Stigmatella erecta TaxID=83460 RepID=A0A1I0LF02_9BACT|nr:lamin tail domain-containing protein [Stigmatella erecta]SEU38690.1 SMI1 / KNR4 family (SUKH-1) [Stigmatella erecta]
MSNSLEHSGTAIQTGVVIVAINHKGAVKRTQSDEYVVIANRGAAPADVSGWVLSAGDGGQGFTFPMKTVLVPGQTVHVYTNEVHPETGGFSFQSKRSVWNDKGGVAQLRDAQRKLVAQIGYGAHAGVDAVPAPTGPSAPPTGPSASSGAETGGSASLSAQEVWARVKAYWPGFEFMWQPGNTEEEIAAAQARLGVTLPARVRDLMRECSGATGGFPERDSHGYSADVCLLPVTRWKYLNEHQWEDARARQLVTIGTNDYQPGEMFVLLNPDTEEVFLLDTQRDDGPRSQGSFEHWLQQHGLSKDTYLAGPEVDELEFEAGETVAAAIARRHRGWISAEREPAWNAVEGKFIEAVNRLRGD